MWTRAALIVLLFVLGTCFNPRVTAAALGNVTWGIFKESPSYIQDQVQNDKPNYTGDLFICYDAYDSTQ